jgi:hypothetical protein
MGSHTARTVREGALMALTAATLVTAGKARGGADGSAVPASSASSEAEASQQTATSPFKTVGSNGRSRGTH